MCEVSLTHESKDYYLYESDDVEFWIIISDYIPVMERFLDYLKWYKEWCEDERKVVCADGDLNAALGGREVKNVVDKFGVPNLIESERKWIDTYMEKKSLWETFFWEAYTQIYLGEGCRW